MQIIDLLKCKKKDWKQHFCFSVFFFSFFIGSQFCSTIYIHCMMCDLNHTVECIIFSDKKKQHFLPQFPNKTECSICVWRDLYSTFEWYYTIYTRHDIARNDGNLWKTKWKKNLFHKNVFFYPGAQTNFIISTVI